MDEEQVQELWNAHPCGDHLWLWLEASRDGTAVRPGDGSGGR